MTTQRHCGRRCEERWGGDGVMVHQTSGGTNGMCGQVGMTEGEIRLEGEE